MRSVLRTLEEISATPDFSGNSVTAYRKLLRTKSDRFWHDAGEKKAMALFHEAAERVPAYRDFLTKHGVRHASICTPDDFLRVPETDKNNYIQKYPLKARSWDGVLSATILAMSSGTTGEPTIWPRNGAQESEAAFVHEFLFTELFDIEKYRTLMIVGFPMGAYVSGIATAVPAIHTALRHHKLSIVTAGNQKASVLSILNSVSDEFEQIVLVGHPFFVKDVIESAGIAPWKSKRVKTLFCSEGFNEAWRTYVGTKLARNNGAGIYNTYGSSEFLLVGYENPLTIAIRARAEKDATLNRALFASEETPNLFQYNPLLRFIQTAGSDLVITAVAGIPLIRFNQHDHGDVIAFDAIPKDIVGGIRDFKPWKLPFVTLYGRSDQTLVFYAANIYPEHIQLALNEKPYFGLCTGKFTMEKVYTKTMDQSLHIHVELKESTDARSGLRVRLQNNIVQTLERVNMEYHFLRTHLEKNLVPTVFFHPYQSAKYFKSGLKPRYISKENV